MFFFQIFFTIFFIVNFLFFQFHSTADRLISIAIGLFLLAFISFVLIRIVSFVRFLTMGVSLLLTLSTLWMLSNLLNTEFDLLVEPKYWYWVEIIFTILCYCTLYFSIILGFKSDYFTRPFITKSTKKEQNQQLVDTSAIIDGRLLEIAKCGFITNEIIIPQFVIRELQLISDSTNHEKRNKGRRGLDILKQMKISDFLNIQLTTDDFNDVEGVDNKLLVLAKKKGHHIITTDFNLVKVAQIEGVKVLNINQLAACMRANIAVGDKIKVFINKKGNGRNQGIAFLPDDTMIVVEEGEKLIGSPCTVLINNYIQNESGKLAFAQIISSGKDSSQ